MYVRIVLLGAKKGGCRRRWIGGVGDWKVVEGLRWIDGGDGSDMVVLVGRR